MKVLILGATGLLGKPAAQHFSRQGFGLRLFSRNITSEGFPENAEIVKGDVFDPADLQKAVEGCDAIHITLSKLDEVKATKAIVEVAKQNNIQLISYISGSTVDEKNSWFEMINNKLQAEKLVKESGIPYIIFRPTWFFESLSFMVQNGKAMMFGKQPLPWSWLAADDLGRMLVKAYQIEEAKNQTFYIHGPEKMPMKDILLKYAQKKQPGIKKITAMPFGMMKFIAFITGKKQLKMATKLFAYFEKTPEMGDPTEANQLLGAPGITFEEWLKEQ